MPNDKLFEQQADESRTIIRVRDEYGAIIQIATFVPPTARGGPSLTLKPAQLASNQSAASIELLRKEGLNQRPANEGTSALRSPSTFQQRHECVLLHVRQSDNPIHLKPDGSLELDTIVPCSLLGGMSAGLRVRANVQVVGGQLQLQWYPITAVDVRRNKRTTPLPQPFAAHPWDHSSLPEQDVEQLYPTRPPRFAVELGLPLQWENNKSTDTLHIAFAAVGSVLSSQNSRVAQEPVEDLTVTSLIVKRTIIPSDGDGRSVLMRLLRLKGARTSAPFGEDVSLRLPVLRERTAATRKPPQSEDARRQDSELHNAPIETGGGPDRDIRDLTIWSSTWPESTTPILAYEFALMDADGVCEGYYVIHGFEGRDVPRLWNIGVSKPYRKSLLIQQRGQPFSPVPAFARTDEGTGDVKWMARIVGPNPSRLRTGWRVDRLQPIATSNAAAQKPIDLSFPAMRSEHGRAFCASGRVVGFGPPLPTRHEVAALNELSKGQFAFRIENLTPADSFTVDSALEQLPRATSDETVLRAGSIAFTVASKVAVPPGAEIYSTFAADFESLRDSYQVSTVLNELSVPVQQAEPGAQDAPAGDIYTPSDAATSTELEIAKNDQIDRRFDRETPLVIQLREGKSRTGAIADLPRYNLQVLEQTRVDRTRLLEMKYTSDRRAATSQPMRTLVVDSDPFMVGLVEFDDFTSQQRDGSYEIARWKSVSPYNSAWRIQGGRGTSRLMLPPQAIAEPMVRSRTDSPPETDVFDFRLGQRPTLTLERSAGRQRSADALTGEIQDTSQDSNFTEVPWNLRRTLGDPDGDRQGAKLKSVQVELVYGLSCRIDAPSLRLSELFARIGAIPGRIPVQFRTGGGTALESRAHDARREHWSQVYEQYRSRVALLEPWDADEPGNLVLNDGVRCILRAADVEEFGSVPPSPGTGLAPLKGGALRGVEVGRIYQAIRADPRSTSATIAEPYLSSMGGWGFQKASFDLNRSSVYAHVSLGRTQDYTVERIGRIGVLWNRAKHVIVYERTVLASDQFQDLNDAYDGRAVLRKVEEYVEILEVSRRYPEKDGSPMMPAFVSGSHFPTPSRIHVNSAWGSDVGNHGWQVPLWKTDADSKVYPKPEISLSLLCKTQGRVEETMGCISNPANLYFYTTTERPTANSSRDLGDTDQWEAEPDVDFAVLPWPKPCRTEHEPCAYDLPSEGEKAKSMAADDSAIPPGYERFTFVLEKPALQANIAAGREAASVAQAMGAFVETVTMTRGAGRELPDEGIVAARKKIVNDFVGPSDALAPVMEAVRNLSTDGKVAVGAIRNALQKGGTLTQTLNHADEAVKGARDHAIKALRISGTPAQAKAAISEAIGEALRQEAQAFRERFLKGRPQSRVEDFLADATSDFSQYATDYSAATTPEGRKRLCARLTAAVQARVDAFRLTLASSGANPDRMLTLVRQNLEVACVVVTQIERACDELVATINTAALEKDLTIQRGKVRDAVKRLASSVSDMISQATTDLRHLLPNVAGAKGIVLPAAPLLDQLTALTTQRIEAVSSDVTWAIAQGNLALDPVRAQATQVRTDARAALNDVIRKVGPLPASPTTTIIGELEKSITSELERLCNLPTLPTFPAFVERLRGSADAFLARVAADLGDLKASKYAQVWIDDAKASFDGLARDAADLHQATMNEWASVEQTLSSFRRDLERMQDDAQLEVEHLQNHLAGMERRAREIGRRTIADLTNVGLTSDQRQEVMKQAGSVISLVRAFGNPPEVPQITFNRKRIGYYYGPVPTVDITPVVAYAKDIGDNLNALGVRLPTRQLAERLIPDALENFDFNRCFSSLAGMKLPKLFQGFKLPRVANDRVKITHGIDPQSRRGWLNAELQEITVNPGELFTLGPLTVRIPSARFKASSRMEAALDGTISQRAVGQIVGTFEIVVGGTPIVLIRDTTLSFNNGKIRFEVKPANVEMQAALKFISDVMKKFVGEDSGLTITFYPGGIESRIALPLPDTQSGTTGISGLSLHAYFALEYAPEFVIAAGVSLATPEKPFALTVFILGGGGYIDVSARYLPRTGDIGCRVRIAVNASASLAITLGPIKGGVYVYLGCEVAFDAGRGRKTSLSFGVFLLIRGEVDLLGIISVCLALHLSVTYNGEGLIARGRVTIKIKICAFFTLKVDQSVQYRLGCVTQQSIGTEAGNRIHTHVPDGVNQAPATRRRPPTIADCQKWAGYLVNLAA